MVNCKHVFRSHWLLWSLTAVLNRHSFPNWSWKIKFVPLYKRSIQLLRLQKKAESSVGLRQDIHLKLSLLLPNTLSCKPLFWKEHTHSEMLRGVYFWYYLYIDTKCISTIPGRWWFWFVWSGETLKWCIARTTPRDLQKFEVMTSRSDAFIK